MTGAIELPISCAQVLDPDNISLEFWRAGVPANDPRAEYYEGRLQRYDLAIDSLSFFEEKSTKAREMNRTGANNGEDPENVQLQAYQFALVNEDELFHSSLYDWLIGKGLADELLDVRESHSLYHPFKFLPLDANSVPGGLS